MMRYTLVLIILLLSKVNLQAQNCLEPLSNCKQFSQKKEKGVFLQIDTSYSETIEFILWNLTNSDICVSTYHSHLDISIQYFDTLNHIWKNADWDIFCGTGYGQNVSIPYSYTRKNYSISNYLGNELNQVRFYVVSTDTIIYSKVLNLKIDPIKFKSQNEQKLYYADRVLNSNETSDEEKQNALYSKALILSNEKKYLESLSVFERLNTSFKSTDKIIYNYTLNLLKYYNIETMPIKKYLIICKSIELLEKLANSKDYLIESTKLLTLLNDKLISKTEWIELNKDEVLFDKDELRYKINNVSLTPVLVLFSTK